MSLSPLVSSNFVGYVEKVKKKDTLCTTFPLAEQGFSSLSSFCKKWTFQCEVCGLKRGHCNSWTFLLNKKRQVKNWAMRCNNLLFLFEKHQTKRTCSHVSQYIYTAKTSENSKIVNKKSFRSLFK